MHRSCPLNEPQHVLAGHRQVIDDRLVRLVPDHRAVVVDLQRVELQLLINPPHTPRRPGRRDHDLHATLHRERQRCEGVVRHLLGIIQERAVEIDRDEADGHLSFGVRGESATCRG